MGGERGPKLRLTIKSLNYGVPGIERELTDQRLVGACLDLTRWFGGFVVCIQLTSLGSLMQAPDALLLTQKSRKNSEHCTRSVISTANRKRGKVLSDKVVGTGLSLQLSHTRAGQRVYMPASGFCASPLSLGCAARHWVGSRHQPENRCGALSPSRLTSLCQATPICTWTCVAGVPEAHVGIQRC